MSERAGRTVGDVQQLAGALCDSVGQVLIGLDDVVRMVLTALLVDGHVLLEEVPGTGKTTLAKALARSLDLGFRRVQFTPDLLPGDVTGHYWFDQKAGQFAFRAGPVFTNVLLADEINRATPRTQSALLEAMQERQVTIEGERHALPQPFIVLATQNPVELEGTFPLPEAQVDRFLMRLHLGYPSVDDEHALLRRHAALGGDPLDALAPVADAAALGALRAVVRDVAVNDPTRDYLVRLSRATRDDSAIELGVSPRGTLFLYRAAQAYAATDGRDYVIPDDIKAVAVPVLAHRIVVDPGLRLRGRSAESVVTALLERVAVPVEP